MIQVWRLRLSLCPRSAHEVVVAGADVRAKVTLHGGSWYFGSGDSRDQESLGLLGSRHARWLWGPGQAQQQWNSRGAWSVPPFLDMIATQLGVLGVGY